MKKKHPKSNQNLKQTKSKAGSVHEHPQVGWTELESELEKKDNDTKSEDIPKPMSTISIPTRDPTTSLTTRATSTKNTTPLSSTSTPGKKKTIPPSSTSSSTSPTKKKASSDAPVTPGPCKTPALHTSEETKSGQALGSKTFMTVRIIMTLLYTDGDVSCGEHRSASCSECGYDEHWCNGDCIWSEGECIKGKKMVHILSSVFL